jgi:hypothetical protein
MRHDRVVSTKIGSDLAETPSAIGLPAKTFGGPGQRDVLEPLEWFPTPFLRRTTSQPVSGAGPPQRL